MFARGECFVPLTTIGVDCSLDFNEGVFQRFMFPSCNSRRYARSSEPPQLEFYAVIHSDIPPKPSFYFSYQVRPFPEEMQLADHPAGDRPAHSPRT